MNKAATKYQLQVSKLAQQSAASCCRLGAVFRAIASIVVLRSRAKQRLNVVRRRCSHIAIHLLTRIRVSQVLSMQLGANMPRSYFLSHFWLHSKDPYSIL